MGVPYRIPDEELPPRPREVPRTQGPSKIPRAFIVAAIVLAVLVIVGVAIFLTRLGGRGPAPAHNAPKAPTSMWVGKIG